MGTPLATVSTNDLIYSYMLASRYRSPYVFDPSNALANDADIWTTLMADADVASCIQRRNQSIVRPWRVVPSPHGTSKSLGQESIDASRKFAAICHEGLSNIDRFDAARRTLAESFILGRRYAKIYWEEQVVSLDGTPPMRWFMPIKIKDVDRRRFHWEPVWSQGPTPTKIRTDLKMFDTNRSMWQTLTPDMRRTYIEYVWQDTEDRLGYGWGALEALFYTHYFKGGTIKRLIEGIDRWANGFLIGKLDSLRAASTDLTNAELTTKMKEMLQKIRSDHVGVVEKTDELQLLEPTGKGLQIALDLVRYFNESAERLCNGSVRPAGHSVDGTGSKGAGKTEEDTSESFYQFPREDLDNVLDRDLLGAFIYYNEGTLKEIGLENAKRPRFVSAQIKKQNPVEAVEVMMTLLDHGIPILRNDVYGAAELTPPGPDDDVLEGANIGMAGLAVGEDGLPEEKSPPKDPNKIPPKKPKPKR